MNRKFFLIFNLFIILFVFVVSGCMTANAPNLPYSNKQKSNLTAGMVKKYVKVDQATQTDILSVFGAPNIITRDKDGHEVWTYDKQSMASSSEIAAWNAAGSGTAAATGLAGDALVGGIATVGAQAGKNSTSSRSSSTTFTLMISFTENDVVKYYRMRATQF